MTSTEYLSNGNHSNGNGKIFHLKPATDPDTLAILDARARALEDMALHPSARAYFCRILDLALHPGFYECKGVVTISDKRIAKTFGVTERTIYNWKTAVAKRGYWWLSKKFVPNMWPLTTYNISCLHKPSENRRTDSHGTYGGEHVRQEPANPGQGARKPGQPGLPLPGSRKAGAATKNADSRQISGESREGLRARAEMDCGSEPKQISGESRNEFRARAETDCGSEPKQVAGESRSAVPSTPEAECGLIETQKRVKRVQSESLKRLDDNRACSGAEKLTEQQRETEAEFLDHCGQVLGKAEVTANGGLWRQLFRQHKSKAWAVINETRSMVREGRIKKSAAACAMDLWAKDRLNYDGRKKKGVTV